MPDKASDPEKDASINPGILGKILLLQAGLNAIPSAENLVDFLCRGLESMPGIQYVAVQIFPFRKLSNDEPSSQPFENPVCELCLLELKQGYDHGFTSPGKLHEPYYCIRFQTVNAPYGCILFEKKPNDNSLAPYQPFLENLANTVALTLELQNQDRQLKQANEALQEAKEGLEALVLNRTKELTIRNLELQRWAHIFEHAELGIAVVSADGVTVELTNPAFARLRGYRIEELIGFSFLEIFPLEIREVALNNIMAAREKGYHIWESIHLHKNGNQFPVSIDATTVRDEAGKVLYYVFNIQDITDRKRAEEQVKKSLAEKETLLRELYHRTKNNMSVIIALLQLQSDYLEDPHLKQALLDTQSRIRSMSLVHEKLYDVSDLSQINLKEYIINLLDLLLVSYSISSEKVSIVSEMEDVFVLIDTAIPCGLILNEMVSNALKYAFTDGEPGEIKVKMRRTEESEICLCVSDNGEGLPAGFDPTLNGHMGMQIIYSLAEIQLQAQVNLCTDQGVSWQLRFKDNHDQARV